MGDMLAAVTDDIERLAAVDVSTLCDAEIRETFLALRRDIDRREAVAAMYLAAVDGRGIAAGEGLRRIGEQNRGR